MTKLALPFVEFVGLPASGKSTLAEAVAERAVREEYPVRTTRMATQGAQGLFRLASRTSGFVVESVRHPMETAAVTRLIWQSNQPSFRDFLGIWVNWFVVKRWNEHLSDDQLVLCDQGIVQAVWSIALASAKSNVSELYRLTRQVRVSARFLVVCVDVDATVVENRLREREAGYSSRLDGYDETAEALFRRGWEQFAALKACLEQDERVQCLSVSNNTAKDLDEAAERVLGAIRDSATPTHTRNVG